MPLLTYQVEDYGASAAQVTSLKAIDSVARFLFVPIRVWLSDWVGHRPVPLVSIASRALKLACSG